MILNNILRLLTVCALAFLGALSQAYAAAPASSSITYNLFRNGIMLGTITEQFEIKDGSYRATSEARATGLFALAQREPARYLSTGAVTKDGLRPQRFEGHHRGKSVSADFDWAAHKLTLIHDGLNHALALPAGAQDRLSIMYQLMFAVRSMNTKASTLDFAMTNGRKLERYRYAVQPDVTIDTPFKRLNTIHLVKQREPDASGTEVWIAPEYGHLPVKVVIIEDDGVRYEQVATRVEINP
ncbi:MAG TPA: DUF3108 domain-containing protein [Burkholderiales bacterium]|nr:DUF3108 domain-containing protein [Burkholderiales bacterium]